MRRCSNCFKTKDESDFYRKLDGLQSRCKACNNEVVAGYKKKIYCTNCNDTGEVNGAPFSEENQIHLVPCSECCPHDELDHGICMDCEKDFSEEISARAYDTYKDRMKYGDM